MCAEKAKRRNTFWHKTSLIRLITCPVVSNQLIINQSKGHPSWVDRIFPLYLRKKCFVGKKKQCDKNENLFFPYLHISSLIWRAINSLGIWKESILSDICSRICIHLLSEVGNLYNLHTGFLSTGEEDKNKGHYWHHTDTLGEDQSTRSGDIPIIWPFSHNLLWTYLNFREFCFIIIFNVISQGFSVFIRLKIKS